MSNDLRARHRLAFVKIATSQIARAIAALRAVSWAWQVGLVFLSLTNAAAAGVNVTTYHYDNYRTGWNNAETALTPAAVAGSRFGLLASASLNDQVYAQPLVMTQQTIAGHGAHDVVYVATEHDTIYAVDANTGAVLLSRNFGVPVPMSDLPGGCNNNGNYVGIEGTPVIDAQNGVLYFIAFHLNPYNKPEYHVHEISLSTLKDIVAPVHVSASGALTEGKTYTFHPGASRQRAALLLANGNVYAGFASFCDIDANISRGWVLGWTAGTLAPLASNQLNNRLAHDPDSFFLSSVWMAGYGLASGGPNGDIYFVTGNSDYNGTTIDGVENIAESVVQLSADLSTVKSVFTPDDAGSLDEGDTDFGSGGALLLPPQTGQTSDLLVAAGKEGNMFFLNADNLNNNTTGAARILGTYYIGGCWCGQSYFTASNGVGRVVASGGNNVNIYRVKTGIKPALSLVASTAGISGIQDPGFFTAVSTNGTTKGSGVIWAVGRPDGSANEYVSLNAFNADTGATLYSANAGTWPNTSGDANIAPVAANGKVYVASYQQLAIFGLGATAGAAHIATPRAVSARMPLPAGQHEFYGTVAQISGAIVTVRKRDGALVNVDASKAAASFAAAAPVVGHGVLVRGADGPGGTFIAATLLHAKDQPAMWLSDR